jgi:hypothetical protein
MNAEEKLERMRALTNARSKKYYEAHKVQLAEQRKKHVTIEPIPEIATRISVVKKKLPGKGSLEFVLSELQKQDANKKHISNTKQLFHIFNISDIFTAFKNSDEVLHTLDNASQVSNPTKKYSTNSKYGFIQSILKLITEFKIPVSDKTKQKLADAYESIKLQAVDESNTKEKNDVPTFEEYLKEVSAKYGADSKEYIIASLYSVSGFRDNLQLKFITDIKEADDKTINYILVPVRKKYQRTLEDASIILNVYKTSDKYHSDTINLDKAMSDNIKNYITVNNIHKGEYIFGDKPLTTFIIRFNKAMGKNMGINTYRQMLVSEKFAEEMTYDDRVALAKKMKHSPGTSLKYVRPLKK